MAGKLFINVFFGLKYILKTQVELSAGYQDAMCTSPICPSAFLDPELTSFLKNLEKIGVVYQVCVRTDSLLTNLQRDEQDRCDSRLSC